MLRGTGYTLNTVLALRGRQSFTLRDGTGLVAVAVTKAGADQTDERATTDSDPKLGMGHGELLLWGKAVRVSILRLLGNGKSSEDRRRLRFGDRRAK